MDYAEHVTISTLRAQKRDDRCKARGKKGQHGIHYPVPVHLQNAYASLGLKADSFPVAEKSGFRIRIITHVF